MNTFDLADTICAISTPPGVGGIAVIRISGPQAIAVTSRLWHGKRSLDGLRNATAYGLIGDGEEVLDEAIAAVWRAPHSYTGQDVVELSVHGSMYIQQRLLELLTAQGCRLAERGEFTRRAFANGRLDLARAEAVADVIASTSQAQHRLAVSQMRGNFSQRLEQLRAQLLQLASLLELELDFSEEDVEFASRPRLRTLTQELLAQVDSLAGSFAQGNAIRNGIPVAIIGTPNAGKSTLLNGLLGHERAIVSPQSGTTRDTVEDSLTIDGRLFRLIDTAGLRSTSDPVEQLGIQRSRQALTQASVIIWVIDPTASLTLTQAVITDLPTDAKIIAVINKADIMEPSPQLAAWLGKALPQARMLNISAKLATDISKVAQALSSLAPNLNASDVVVTNARHHGALVAASQSLQRVLQGLDDAIPTDLVAQDLREVLYHLGSITGAVTSAEVLSTIFSAFCVGK